MLSLLGIENQVVQYPAGNEYQIFLPRATFQCSASARPGSIGSIREFWQAHKLRHLFLAQLSESGGGATTDISNRTAIVVINRKHATGRRVSNHEEVLDAVKEAFVHEHDVIEVDGTPSFKEQMRVFHRAVVVVGPHGATMSIN